MATNLPSASKKPNQKGESPTKTISKSDMIEITALNFRVPVEFKKDFKIAAVTHGITQSDLLQQIFKEWQKKHN